MIYLKSQKGTCGKPWPAIARVSMVVSWSPLRQLGSSQGGPDVRHAEVAKFATDTRQATGVQGLAEMRALGLSFEYHSDIIQISF